MAVSTDNSDDSDDTANTADIANVTEGEPFEAPASDEFATLKSRVAAVCIPPTPAQKLVFRSVAETPSCLCPPQCHPLLAPVAANATVFLLY